MEIKEDPFTSETVLNLLRDEGLRITKSRVGIVHCLFDAKGPLSLQEIQEAAAQYGGVKPDYATVFRTISLMEKLHLVHKVNLQRPCSFYELHDPHKHYDHLICRVCGHVQLLNMPCTVGEAQKQIAQLYGFRDLSHSLEFFGICPVCAS